MQARMSVVRMLVNHALGTLPRSPLIVQFFRHSRTALVDS